MPSIRLYEPTDFLNLLPEIRLTATDIEKQAAAITYKADPYKYEQAEIKYPIETVPVFYRFVTREQRIPTQDEFLKEARREMQMNGFDLDGQDPNYKQGLIARLTSRTYPSLIRDLHFCKLLDVTLSQYFDILYNPALDLLGIDILMIPKYPDAPYYGVCLFLNTKDGWRGLNRKRHYRKQYYNVKYIELPKTKPANVGCNNIWLYDNGDATRLLELIKSPL